MFIESLFKQIKGIGIVKFILLISFFICFFILLSQSFYSRYISYNINTEKLYITVLPNQLLDEKTQIFIVDGKELHINKFDKNVKYEKQNNDNPYIIVEKVSYKAENKWYTNKKICEKVNNTTKYILKEIHY